MQKQVEKDHYLFSNYMNKNRWSSIWCQLNEVYQLSLNSVLEIGPGPGVFKATAAAIGIKIDTVDLDPELQPDYIASATSLPFADQSYDIVCAFQMLEHLPFEDSLKALAEMSRVAKKNIIISLPDVLTLIILRIKLPKLKEYQLNIPVPLNKIKTHVFDGEHYWEINKRNYSLKKVQNAFLASTPSIKLVRTYRNPQNPYHRFFIFEKS